MTATPTLHLTDVVRDFADALAAVDSEAPVGRSARRKYQPGVGPLTERHAIQLAVGKPAAIPGYFGLGPMRYPGSRQQCDLVIPNGWAIEVKVARPFGDNGVHAEHWSENLLHPYPGSVSALGDLAKLAGAQFELRKAMIIVGYEHEAALVPLEPAIRSFELLAERVMGIVLSARCEEIRTRLIHSVHQVLRVYGWSLDE